MGLTHAQVAHKNGLLESETQPYSGPCTCMPDRCKDLGPAECMWRQYAPDRRLLWMRAMIIMLCGLSRPEAKLAPSLIAFLTWLLTLMAALGCSNLLLAKLDGWAW